MSAPVPAIVEALLFAAFPGDAPHPQLSVAVTASDSVEIVLDGDETPLFRVLALAMLASAIGDEDGPEMIPGRERYTCGEWSGTFFLIRTPVTAEQQAELVALGGRIAEGVGE